MKRVRITGEGPSDGTATPRRSLSLTLESMPGDLAPLARSRSSPQDMETQEREPQSPLVQGQAGQAASGLSPALRDMCSPGSDLEWEPSQPCAQTQAPPESALPDAAPAPPSAWARFTGALEREDPRFSASLPGVQMGDWVPGTTTLKALLADATGTAAARVGPPSVELSAGEGDAREAARGGAAAALGSWAVDATAPFGSQQSLDAARGPGAGGACPEPQARAHHAPPLDPRPLPPSPPKPQPADPPQAPEEACRTTPPHCRLQVPALAFAGLEATDMASPGEAGGSQFIASPLPSPPGEEGLHAGAAVARRPLYPIFMPRGQKTLHFVRHGESEYNAACGRPGSSWEEPLIFDAPLSARGQAQARGLGPTLRSLLGADGGTLWVASPLTRAIQTGVLARGAFAQRPPAAADGQWMVLRPELAEHLMTSGDVGRPAPLLAAAFAEQLPPASFAQLADIWWHCPPGRPNCAHRRLLQGEESMESLRRRIGLFRKWACSRPERELVIFGHSTWIKYFCGAQRRLHNCEVCTVYL